MKDRTISPPLHPALPSPAALPALSPSASLDARSDDRLEAPFVKAKFDGLVLVCSKCQERSDGPPKRNAKDVRRELKEALRSGPVRWRMVQSSCLGLCPKKAIAVAAAGPGLAGLMAEVHRPADSEAVAARLSAVQGLNQAD